MWRSARLQRQREELAAAAGLAEIVSGRPVVPVKDESGRPTGALIRASLMERLIAFATLLCGGYPELGHELVSLLEAPPRDPKVVAEGLLTLYRKVHV